MGKASQKRRRRPAAYADIQIALTHLIFKGLLGIVILGGIGMAGGTAVVAGWYHDRWLWQLSAVMCLLCSLRVAVVIAFHCRRAHELTAPAALAWEWTYNTVLLLVCSALFVSTVYNFRRDHQYATYWCTVGIFAFSSGISSRVALRPLVANASGLMLLSALAYALLQSPEPLTRLTTVLIGFFGLTYCTSNRSKFAVLVNQVRTERKLLDLSEHDALTNLANRRRFQALLGQARVSDCALLYLDLDRFKAVNDTFGHAAGDALLKAVAERLHHSVRSSDVLARLGGDEFAIFQYPDATEATAQALAARITETVSQPYMLEGKTVKVGVSVGICLPGKLAIDMESALHAADRALYTVKQAGGNSFSMASV